MTESQRGTLSRIRRDMSIPLMGLGKAGHIVEPKPVAEDVVLLAAAATAVVAAAASVLLLS